MQEAGPSGKQVHEQCSVPLKRGETESRRSHAQGQVSAAAGPGFGSSARIPEDGGAEPPLGALLPLSCSGVPVRGAPLCEWAQGGSHGRPADRVPPPRWLRLPRTTRVWSSDSWGPLLGTPPPKPRPRPGAVSRPLHPWAPGRRPRPHLNGAPRGQMTDGARPGGVNRGTPRTLPGLQPATPDAAWSDVIPRKPPHELQLCDIPLPLN